jgi:hypothetical protein
MPKNPFSWGDPYQYALAKMNTPQMRGKPWLDYATFMKSYQQMAMMPMGGRYDMFGGRKQGTLYERTHSNPFVGFWDQDVRPALRSEIEAGSDHGSLTIFGRWAEHYQQFAIQIHCRSCEKNWRLDTTREELYRLKRDYADWKMAWVDQKLAPWHVGICSDACFGPREEALLAEWLTLRLARAGERGMPYVQLVHEAVEARLVPPADVDMVLRKLKFVEEWVKLANSGLILPGTWDGEWTLPILTLPNGHPLKTW